MSGRHRENECRDEAAPAAFVVACPGCRTHVAVARGLVGHVASCPRCHAAFLVPVPGPEERRPPRPAPEVRHAAPAAGAAPLQSPDEPLVFSEPPVPSTRRLLAESPTATPTAPTEAADPIPDSTSVAATTSAVAADGLDGVAFPDSVRVIRSGGVEIELRRLTPEERRSRRARRNLILLVVGAALLVALVVILGKGGR